MLFNQTQATSKRENFREALKSGKLLKFPGAFSPLSAMQIEKLGFEGVYISGSVLSNDLGYPDVGLTTMSEVINRGRQIARVTKLPSIIDADTGFGVALNAARTVQEMIEMGLAGCHFEDQENPKRCGHLDGKTLVSTSEMVQKIKAADQSRKLDPNFVIIARTDARASEGLDKAIERAAAYVDAGADVIFTEALQDEKEFAIFRKAIKAPLLANMTEFGKTKLLTIKELENLGYNIVIWPVTTLRLAMKAQEEGLKHILSEGSQTAILDKMQHRKELYALTDYDRYNAFDQNIFNFKL
jgi:methylisocitrate lyase